MEDHIRYDPEQGVLFLLDQRLLPTREEFYACRSTRDVLYAIREMVVRGAPALGIVGAFACVLAARETQPGANREAELDARLEAIARARPTAVNLSRAVSRMRGVWRDRGTLPMDGLVRVWEAESERIRREDIEANRRMGAFGAVLVNDGETVLTHCNAGALATAGFGTALGVVYAAFGQGKDIRVIAGETRPLLQGARLTAYELCRQGVPVAIACDNAYALLMQRGMVQKVITGADRIAANGDTANKIGTYGAAILARAHGIPFYVAAPLSTVDLETSDGAGICIEERPETEVTCIAGARISPEGVPAYNFAFDVTPAELIGGIITDAGVLRPPYAESLKRALDREGRREPPCC
ncbi:MAG: S-methyl-5-thioribose-1-phosphate isomerase [Desulfovibrio sp.]|jgi:methylthioribose-1-phosphate isomerase|nr:S-methyl-5-thioribose-1-phosphate isomerase [Desulfovibrio sp.]